MFRSSWFNSFLFYIMVQQFIITWSIHIVIVIIIYYVCALQGIRFIISSIWLIIVVNSKVRALVCFKWIQIFYDLTPFIFLMHSHSYFTTHKYYLLFWFYHIPPSNFTMKRQAPKYRPRNKDKKKEYPSTKRPLVSRGDWTQWVS